MKNSRLEYLDSLRGLAALSVVASHLIDSYGLPNSLSFLEDTIFVVLYDGKAAVKLFFVLSGFVLAYKYFQSREKIHSFSFIEYATARVFRIMPLFWFMLLISAIIRFFFLYDFQTIPAEASRATTFWSTTPSVTGFLKEAILVVRMPAESLLRTLPQDHTLTGELKFSLFIPFLVIVSMRSQLLLLAAMLFYGIFFNSTSILFDFYLGVAAAANIDFLREKWRSTPSFVKVGLLILAVVLYASKGTIVREWPIRHQAVALGSFLMIIIIMCSEKLQKALSINVMTFLGRISYGIYLTHFTILLAFIPLFLHWLNQIGIQDDYSTRILILLCLVSLTIIVSTILYSTIELPGIKLGKMVTAKMKGITSAERYCYGLLGKVNIPGLSRSKPDRLEKV